jgi:short subunit dehydrogenase-like uncharacterized protein
MLSHEFGILLIILAIELVQQTVDELSILTKKTKILLNCIGPYYLYSFPVVEACVKTGTHYLDVYGYLSQTLVLNAFGSFLPFPIVRERYHS